MKHSIIGLFIFYSINIFGQNINESIYCSPADFVGYCIKFKKDRQFEYTYWTCLGDEKGNGNYIQSKRKLILNFTNPDTLSKNSVVIADTISTNTDSSTLYFSICDIIDNEPLPFVNIVPFLNGIQHGSSTSDINGYAKINLKKSNAIHEVKIAFVGFKTYTFNIRPECSKLIKVKLAEAQNNYVQNGVVWTYKIVKETKEQITLRKNRHNITLQKHKE